METLMIVGLGTSIGLTVFSLITVAAAAIRFHQDHETIAVLKAHVAECQRRLGIHRRREVIEMRTEAPVSKWSEGESHAS